MSEAIKEPILRQRTSAGYLRFMDALSRLMATSGALVMVGLLALLLIVVFVGARPAMEKFGWPFLWTRAWRVVQTEARPQQFGAVALIYGTLSTSCIALIISFPISLGSAIFLTKLAPKLRIPLPTAGGFRWFSPRYAVTVASFLIELLAAIPSIAYGLWGVFVLVPFMQKTGQPAISRAYGPFRAVFGSIGEWLHHLQGMWDWWFWTLHKGGDFFAWASSLFTDTGAGSNIFTAGLILAIMVTPIMTAIIRDVLTVAPPELEQGALGLGATWWQATRLVLGFSRMGIFGAVILGFARAIGETMAVTMVIGNSNSTDATLFSQGDTIASKLANQFINADTDGEKYALIYAAFVLLVVTVLINGIARVMVMRLSARAKRK